MVKRLILLLLLFSVLAWPAAAQDFSTLDVAFGYGNYGTEALQGTDRVHGFAMHTSLNLASWISFENFTGAYSLPSDITLVANTFGAKLVARDVVDGRLSPYVAGGFGIGYYTSNQTGGGVSTASARYAFGIDFNLSGGMALKFDVGGLALGKGVVGGAFVTNGWRDAVNVTTGIVFNLGG